MGPLPGAEVTMHALLTKLGLILAAAAAAYAVLAALASALAAARTRHRACDSGAVLPAVTVLKPLCGAEFELYERLCALCAQDYPRFQVVFGVQNPADTALPVARRVQQQFAALDIECVIDPTRHGVNAKISNLVNMLPRARHDLLILADSDIAVPPDYLRRVLAPLHDPRVGLVTCAYAGRAGPGLWSALGAQFINDWFMPSVYFAALFGSQWFVSGATIALRRELLARPVHAHLECVVGGLVLEVGPQAVDQAIARDGLGFDGEREEQREHTFGDVDPFVAARHRAVGERDQQRCVLGSDDDRRAVAQPVHQRRQHPAHVAVFR